MYLLIPKKELYRKQIKECKIYQIKESQSQILISCVIKIQNYKNTPYRQLKKQQLGKQSRKLRPWFIGLLEMVQQKHKAPIPWST